MSSPTHLGLDTLQQRERVAARMFGTGEPVKLGRFSIDRKLGEGGMGDVYLALDPVLHRRVAIKVLKSPSITGSDRSARAAREAELMARVSHPNVVSVHEAGPSELGFYVVMEYIDGQDLRRSIGAGLTFERIYDIARQMVEGLHALHTAGIVHRDLKPANVLVGADGRVRIADFGLSVLFGLSVSQGSDEPSPSTDGSQPRTPARTSGGIIGTPAYMAPEQLAGTVDERSDIFSLCVTLFELAFGTRPYEAQNLQELAQRYHDARPIPVPRGPTRIPRWFTRVLVRGLELDPRDRWPDTSTLLARLRGGSGRRRARWAWASMAIVVPLVGLGLAKPDCEATDLDQRWREGARTVLEERARKDSGWLAAIEHFDGWVANWEMANQRACAGPKDERLVRCLDDARRIFADVSDLAAQSRNNTQLRWLVMSADALPSIRSCEDQSLDGEGSRVLAEMYAAFSAAAGASRRAEWTEVERLIEPVWTEANHRGWWTLATMAALLRHEAARAMENYPTAERWAERELEAAERTGNAELQVSAWIAASKVARTRRDYDRSREALDRARNLAESDLVGAGSRAFLALETGLLALALERNDEAIAALEAADRGYVAAYGENSPNRAPVLLNLGLPRMETGDLDGAIEGTREALRIREHNQDDHVANLVEPLTLLAQFLAFKGRNDEAWDAAERARALAEDHATPPRRRLEVTVIWAGIAADRGAYDEAYGAVQDAIGHFDAMRSGDHIASRCAAEGTLGVVAMEAGNSARAIDHFTLALDCPALSAYNTLIFRTNLAAQLAAVGAQSAADRQLEAARALAPKFARDVELLADLQVYWAEVAERAGRHDEARSLYADTLAKAESLDLSTPEVEMARAGLARLR